MKRIFGIAAAFCLAAVLPAGAQEKTGAQSGTVYVPAYSSILYGELKTPLVLSVMLSIHNIDTKTGIVLDSVEYFNTAGTLIQSFSNAAGKILKPMETWNLGIKESDDRGGTGANFLVKWHSALKARPPLIETVMIGRRDGLGISFTSRGESVGE